MNSAVTRILLKTFVSPFYRAHAGLLLTLFATVFINFFFTQVLNQTHLNKEQILLNNLKLVLTSVSNPVGMGVLFLIWLGYTVKSCQFVSAQLVLTQNQFLFYSSTSLSFRKQFQAWFLVQAVISLPIMASGFFATAVGLLFNHQFIPIIIPVYLLLLNTAGTFYYIRLVNNLRESKIKSYLLDAIKKLPKPFFSLFLYQIIYQHKIHYWVTKVISAVIIVSIYKLFRDNADDIRIPGLGMLAVILAHTVLIYQSNAFDRTYLQFTRNFPVTYKRLYMQMVAQYLLLLLPEVICFICIYNSVMGSSVSLLGLSFALLLNSILYRQNQDMVQFLKVVFSIFIVSVLSLIFGAFLYITAFNLVISVFIFHRNFQKLMN